MGYVQSKQWSQQHGLAKYGYTMNGMGFMGDDPFKVGDVGTGGMVWFDHDSIDGTFLILRYDPNTGRMVLMPQYIDGAEAATEVDDLLDAGWFTYGNVNKLDNGNIDVDAKAAAKYLKYWDDEFTGQKNVQVDPADKEDIMWVQEFLIENGWLKGTKTGTMDASTIAALKAFQKEFKVSETGKIDQATLNKMCGGLELTGATTTKKKTQPSKKRAGVPAKASAAKEKGKKKEESKTLYYVGGGVAALAVGVGIAYAVKKSREQAGVVAV